jgi:hypothetical protein
MTFYTGPEWLGELYRLATCHVSWTRFRRANQLRPKNLKANLVALGSDTFFLRSGKHAMALINRKFCDSCGSLLLHRQRTYCANCLHATGHADLSRPGGTDRRSTFEILEEEDYVLPNLYSSGRGCPLEPNDDASPGQENAIRALEDC